MPDGDLYKDLARQLNEDDRRIPRQHPRAITVEEVEAYIRKPVEPEYPFLETAPPIEPVQEPTFQIPKTHEGWLRYLTPELKPHSVPEGIKLKFPPAEEGEEPIDVLLKVEEGSLWIEDKQVGSINPQTGEFIPTEPTFWERAAMATLPPLFKGLEAAFLPFTVAGEAVAAPFLAPEFKEETERRVAERMAKLGYTPAPPVTSYEERQERIKAFQTYRKSGGGWHATKWEMMGMPATKEDEPVELTKEEKEVIWAEEAKRARETFLPGGEMFERYRELPLAAQIAAELPAFLLIPAAAPLYAKVRGLPLVGKYLAPILKPAVMAERAPGWAISKVAKVAVKVPPFKGMRAGMVRKEAVKKLAETRARMAAKAEFMTIRDSKGLLGRAPKEHPLKMVDDAYAVGGRVLDQGEGLKWISLSEAVGRGSPFKIDNNDLVIFNKHIMPRIKGASRDIHDIMQNISNYNLSPQARHFVNTLKRSVRDLERLANKEGIVFEKTIENWFPRHVLSKEGIELTRPAGYWTGLGVVTRKHRFWQLAIEGRELSGIKYVNDPILEVSLAWDGLLRRIARKRAAGMLLPLTKVPKAEAVRSRALRDIVQQLGEGRRVDPRRIEALKETFPDFYNRIKETLAADKRLARELAGIADPYELDALKFEIAALEETLAIEPSRGLINLIKKAGWQRGEIGDLTIRQYKALTGRTPTPGMLTRDGKHVRWADALDEKATELGYPSAEALKESIERMTQYNQRLILLKGELASLTAPLKAPQTISAKMKADLDVILADAEAVWAQKGSMYAPAIEMRQKVALDLLQARRTVRNVKKALGGMDVTESIGYDLAKALSKEQNDILIKVQQALIAGRVPQRKLLQEQLAVAEKALIKAQESAKKTMVNAQHMMDAISQEFGEGTVRLAGFGNKVFRHISTFNKAGKETIITSDRIVRRIESKFGEEVAKPIRWAANASSVLRITKAAMDDSAMTIQLAAHMIRHPRAWSEAWPRSLQTLFTDKAYLEKWIQRPGNFEAALEFVYHRGLISTPEYTEAAGLITRVALKAPIGSRILGVLSEQTFGRANAAFFGARMVGVINIWKGMAPMAISKVEKDGLALFLNRSTGYFSLRGMGITAQKRGLLNAFGFFAPRFTFAIGNLIADLPRALLYQFPKAFWMMGAKEVATREAGRILAKQAADRAWWAIEHLGSLYIGGTALYIAACMAAGQEPKLDLRPKSAGGDGADAYSLQIGNHKVRLLGGMFNLVRSIVALGTSAWEGDTERILQDITRTYRSRSAPVTSFFWDVISGKDYIGDASRESWEGFGEYTGMRFVPIWIEAVIDSAQKGEKPGALAVIAAMEFFGGSSFPESEWDIVKAMRQDYISQLLAGGLPLTEPFPTEYQQLLILTTGGLEWKELNRAQKDELKRLHPELKEQEDIAWADSLQRWGSDIERAISESYDEVIQERDEGMKGIAEAFLVGELTPRNYNNQRGYIRPYYSGGMAVLYRFQEEMGLTDEEARTEARKDWTNEDIALSQYKELKGQPIVDEYGMPDWEKTNLRLEAWLAELNENIRQYVLVHQNDWIEDLPPLARMVEKEREADLSFINSKGYWEMEREKRLQARDASPELDATLAFWGYVSVVRSETALVLLMVKADRMGRSYINIPALAEGAVPAQPATGPITVEEVEEYRRGE